MIASGTNATEQANMQDDTSDMPSPVSHKDILPAVTPTENGNNEESTNIIAKFQAQVTAENENAEVEKEDSTDEPNSPVDNNVTDTVWDGDPADGTDFITVVDIPVEDQGITPNYDMFDHPTTVAFICSANTR